MLLSRHRNIRQNRDMKIANRCFENVAQFRYLGMTVTYQNLISLMELPPSDVGVMNDSSHTVFIYRVICRLPWCGPHGEQWLWLVRNRQ
jgi:hypothetical protein